MFLANSRYVTLPTVETTAADGRPVTALKLRPLPAVAGEPVATQANDQLDRLAQEHYGDGTRFWHVADANTALEAHELTDTPGSILNLPAS